VDGIRPSGTPKKIWSQVVENDRQLQQLCKEDAMDYNSKWRRLIGDNV